MDITGDYTQVGTTNSQNINSHNNFHFHFHMNCTESHQHQHHLHEGVASPGGDIHQAIECLQKMVASCGQGTQIKVESAGQGAQITAGPGGQGTQLSAASGGQGTQISGGSGGQAQQISSESGGQAQLISGESGGQAPQITAAAATNPEPEAAGDSQVYPVTTTQEAVTDSVRIIDRNGEVLEPGDAVRIHGVSSLYVGDGYIVYLNEGSGIVVKEKIDLTKPFTKVTSINILGVGVFPLHLRVQRALEHVGRPCPLRTGRNADFIYRTCTGLSLFESIKRWISQMDFIIRT